MCTGRGGGAMLFVYHSFFFPEVALRKAKPFLAGAAAFRHGDPAMIDRSEQTVLRFVDCLDKQQAIVAEFEFRSAGAM